MDAALSLDVEQLATLVGLLAIDVDDDAGVDDLASAVETAIDAAGSAAQAPLPLSGQRFVFADVEAEDEAARDRCAAQPLPPRPVSSALTLLGALRRASSLCEQLGGEVLQTSPTDDGDFVMLAAPGTTPPTGAGAYHSWAFVFDVHGAGGDDAPPLAGYVLTPPAAGAPLPTLTEHSAAACHAAVTSRLSPPAAIGHLRLVGRLGWWQGPHRTRSPGRRR